MNIIRKTANPSGSFPPIQQGIEFLPEGYVVWAETTSTDVFYEYNGFVFLSIEPVDGVDTVVSCAPNVEAWNEWKANLPDEPVEPETEDVNYDEMAEAISEGVNAI